MNVRRSAFPTPLEALLALNRALALFEQRYQMASEEFYARYTTGALGDERDFVEWAGDYQHHQRLKAELEDKLQAVGQA
jgi:hypothetical protein